MGDLIDRDALGVGPANPNVFKSSAYADGWNALLRIINQAPVVDAVPVVRCRDCSVRGTGDCAMQYECSCCGAEFTWETDDSFCSWGEREEKYEPPRPIKTIP